MSTDVSSVTKHFPSAENGFTTTTAGSVSSGAATVTLNSVAGYTNGETVVLVIDPTDAAKKQTFTGVVDTAGVQITGVVWTAGTNQTHALGATVVDYATATHISMVTKGLLRDHNQSGYHKTLNDDNGNEWIKQTSTASAVNEVTIANAATGTNPVISATGGDTNVGLTLTPKGTGAIKATSNYDAWVSGLTAPSTVTANGNRSYDLVINSTDYTDRLSPGMRLKLTRTVTAPTYMGGLFNGSSHYFTKATPTGTLSTITNNFTMVAHVQPTSYATGYVMGRSDASRANAFAIEMQSSGQIRVVIFNAAAGNYRYVDTYQSLALNKKTHVAASWTSGTVVVYFDGVSVPVATAVTAGTNPTVAGTGGDFSVGRAGAYNGSYFPGYISNAGVFDAVLSAATVKTLSGQALTGAETNNIGAWNLNNAGTDSNAAANNLTATGGVGYTAQSPFTNDVTGTSITAGTTNYAIITKASFSTNTTLTVQIPEGETLPTTGGISAVSYSTQKIPYGFPSQRGKWRIESLYMTQTSAAASATTAYNTMGAAITLPVGEYSLWYRGIFYVVKSASATSGQTFSLISATSANATPIGRNFVNESYHNSTGATQVDFMALHYAEGSYTASAQITLYVNTYTELSLAALGWYAASLIPDNSLMIVADNAYL